MSQRDFGYGEEERQLRDAVRKLSAQHASTQKLRALVAKDHTVYESPEPAPWARDAWDAMVGLGLPSMAVPENASGLAAKHVGIVAVVEEIGMHAFPSPLLATFASAFVLARVPDATGAKAALERIANGEPAALALHDARGRMAPKAVGVTAKAGADGGLVLDGEAGFVEDGCKAAFYVVFAREGSELLVVLVERADAGLAVTADRIVDLTRDQARLVFTGCALPPARVLARGRDAEQALARALPALLLLPTADLVGVSEWQLRTTVEYAKVREQFGKPIGSFQAVKHPLVDLMIGIDQAKSLLYAAACAIDEAAPNAELLARMAKSKASDVGRFACGRSVQLHGGIGFTWECDVHLFFKRSEYAQVRLGDGVVQRKRVAELVIDGR